MALSSTRTSNITPSFVLTIRSSNPAARSRSAGGFVGRVGCNTRMLSTHRLLQAIHAHGDATGRQRGQHTMLAHPLAHTPHVFGPSFPEYWIVPLGCAHATDYLMPHVP